MNDRGKRKWQYKFQTAIIAYILLVSLFFGCSEKKTPPTLPLTHPSDFAVRGSANFHGEVALSRGTESCAVCHGSDLNGGEVEVSCLECHIREGGCTTCHGGRDNLSGAPPLGLEGETDISELAVGAHTAHLEASSLAAALDCSTCHIVPEEILDTTHLDLAGPVRDDIAEIVWSGLADNGGTVWNRGTAVCSGSYCHGNFLGGNQFDPVWTGANQADCGSCHDVVGDSLSLSLLGSHKFHVGVAAIDCSECHGTVTDDDLNIIDSSLHVNGDVETFTSNIRLCDACHGFIVSCVVCHGGQDNNTGAPPLGLDGETSTSQLAVGAHTAHIAGNVLSDGIACTECHIRPAHPLNEGHLDSDGVADIDFGPLAGLASVWNREAGSCSSTYCHGNFSGGYSSNSPIWTAGGSQAVCGSCHDVGDNPADLGGRHDDHAEEGVPCYQCHAATTDSDLDIIGLDLHINGLTEVEFTDGNGTYIDGECSNTGCHGPETW